MKPRSPKTEWRRQKRKRDQRDRGSGVLTLPGPAREERRAHLSDPAPPSPLLRDSLLSLTRAARRDAAVLLELAGEEGGARSGEDERGGPGDGGDGVQEGRGELVLVVVPGVGVLESRRVALGSTRGGERGTRGVDGGGGGDGGDGAARRRREGDEGLAGEIEVVQGWRGR